MEGEEVGDGKADEPVGDEAHDGGDAGVVEAAEHGGGGDLDAVEDLEDADDDEEGGGEGDDVWGVDEEGGEGFS